MIGVTGLMLGAYCILYGKHIAKRLFPKRDKRQSLIMVISFAGLVWLLSILSFSKKESITDAPSQITVSVHGKKGKDDLVLPSRGKVTLTYGNAKVTETINHRCEAVFKQIPGEFFLNGFAGEVHFNDPEGEPYHITKPDSQYQFVRDGYILVQVELAGLDKLQGVVKDFETGELISGVRISILDIHATTNEYGEFTLEIPLEYQRQKHTIRAIHEGYHVFEQKHVPLQTTQEQIIALKPLKLPK